MSGFKRYKRAVNQLLVVVGLGLILSGPVRAEKAEDVVGKYADHEQAALFIDEMVTQHGFDREALNELFGEVKFKARIIELMTRPAEAKPWKEYRPIFVTKQRIQQGVAFLNEHRETLIRAESVYGVPKELIVAIIGVETRYGRHVGSFRVIDALSTLAFDYPRRAKFFRRELGHFLVMARSESLNPREVKGSYAGAMGYGQFIPSSFIEYAVDFDGDGRRDIWHNPVDAIGSVASYFHRHGWKAGGEVVARARVSGEAYRALVVKKRADLTPKYRLSELIEAGFEPTTARPLDERVTAMALDGRKGWEYWIGLHNFYVITRYNKSALYAMAVHQLRRGIEKYDRNQAFSS